LLLSSSTACSRPWCGAFPEPPELIPGSFLSVNHPLWVMAHPRVAGRNLDHGSRRSKTTSPPPRRSLRSPKTRPASWARSRALWTHPVRRAADHPGGRYPTLAGW